MLGKTRPGGGGRAGTASRGGGGGGAGTVSRGGGGGGPTVSLTTVKSAPTESTRPDVMSLFRLRRAPRAIILWNKDMESYKIPYINTSVISNKIYTPDKDS